VKVLNVVGARPNFPKIAPLARVLGERGIPQILVHTGQHYDENMSKVFFQDLEMPTPDFYLGVGSGSHAEQTAKVMIAFEKIVLEQKPDLVVVVGDVNSTLACSIVCAKLWVPVAHVEAGLRSNDMRMPEEVNRLVTDRLSELLLTPSPDGDANLLREGAPRERIHRVGNIMIDSLVAGLEKAERSDVLERLGLPPGGYGVLTLHRPSNVDDPGVLSSILGAIGKVAARIPILFSCHPRTASRLDTIGAPPGIRVVPPLGYIDFLKVTRHSRLVLTDSGGLQEETTWFRVPCITIRENTERPITVTEGTNVLAGTDPRRIEQSALDALEGRFKAGRVPDLWDGRTAGRIADVFQAWWKARGTTFA
jgi:UDP-N-acetylglucosamine 2-epimerase (non-hydrolysing)